MDVDGNHMVDYHEFVMGTLEDKQLLTEAKLRAAFDYFDSDRNGYIDIGNFSWYPWLHMHEHCSIALPCFVCKEALQQV